MDAAGSSSFSVNVFQCDANGSYTDTSKSLNDIIEMKREWNLPISDMRIFFQTKDHLPSLLSRPSSQCFLVNMEHIRLLCRKDTCVILHSDDPAIRSFAEDLHKQLEHRSFHASPSCTSLHQFLTALADKTDAKLELVVLETVLANVTHKFHQHLTLMRPLKDLLLQETLANPSTGMLRRMLAFMKSLNAFEMRVKLVRDALVENLSDDDDIAGLCLTQPGKGEEEEMQLLLEAYSSDLKEIECELASIKEQIDDTNDFMNIHLNTVRNNFMKMTAIVEMGTLIIATGTLVTGFFGMNLNNKLEDDPDAFTATCLSTLVFIFVTASVFTLYVRRCTALSNRFNRVVSFHALEEFFNCLEKGEVGTDDRQKLREHLGPVVGGQMTKRKVDKLCKVLMSSGEINGGLEIIETGIVAGDIGNSRRSAGVVVVVDRSERRASKAEVEEEEFERSLQL